MRFIVGEAPTSSEFEPDKQGWHRCREPDQMIFLWVLCPLVALALGAFLTFVTLHFCDVSFNGFNPLSFTFLFPLIVATHEAVHTIFHPDRGLSKRTILGFWPRKWIFYAHFEGSRTRASFLLCLIAPFLVLSVAPLMFLIWLGSDLWVVPVFIIVNGLSSAGDVVAFFGILAVVPPNACVRNRGWYTYWRLAENQRDCC